MVPWYHGTMVPWCHGAMVPWYHGTMVPWCHGTMAPWCPSRRFAWEVSNVALSHNVFFCNPSHAKRHNWDQLLTYATVEHGFKSRRFAWDGVDKSNKNHTRAPLWQKAERCSKTCILEFTRGSRQSRGSWQSAGSGVRTCGSDPPFHTRRGPG